MTEHLKDLRRKADQEWELAGLARVDGDEADEAIHTAKAREYDRLWREGVDEHG